MGFAGTGKYTVGRGLSSLTGAKLVDNHLINNPVFTVLDADGVTPLPAPVWDKVKQIRHIVYDAIRELSPPGLSFIAANVPREPVKPRRGNGGRRFYFLSEHAAHVSDGPNQSAPAPRPPANPKQG